VKRFVFVFFLLSTLYLGSASAWTCTNSKKDFILLFAIYSIQCNAESCEQAMLLFVSQSLVVVISATCTCSFVVRDHDFRDIVYSSV
jgi:hypothetical protein